MSHRFKRSKPLGGSKKSMKSENGESPKPLQTGHDSAEIHDVFYVDRARISGLYAQLFPQGLLTSVKTSNQQNFMDDSEIGSDLKVLKVGTKTTEGGSQGIEHMFDASWSIPLEVIDSLRRRNLIRDSIRGAGLGAIIESSCHFRIVDFASMDKLWEPALKMAQAQNAEVISPETVASISEALHAVPSAIHAHFLSDHGFLWASLLPGGLTIPTSDLTLKYSGRVPGMWKVLYILDAWPDDGEPPDTASWSGGAMADAILFALHGIRTMIGRPAQWVGVTPLMIYRSVGGWLPGVSDGS